MQTELVISTSGAGRRSVSHRFLRRPADVREGISSTTRLPSIRYGHIRPTVGCRASSVSSVSISGPAAGLSRTADPAQPLLEAVWPIQHVEQAEACL